MAVRSVATTQTLDNFRTTFNSLGTDVGDLSSLSTSAKGSIVLAINEINTSVTGTGFTLSDGSTTQTIVTGNTLLVSGTNITAAVSATDTLTLSLPNDISENIFFDLLGAQHNADDSNTYTEIEVKRITKTSAHIYHGTGSALGYTLNGVESPFIQFEPGNTYRFNQSDSSNSSHPLAFYLDAGKNTAYTTGVTTNGTAGSSGAYTQIVVSDTTPQRLYYQCSSHAYMGNYGITLGSNKINHTEALISFPTTTGTLVGTGDTGSVTNDMLAGSIADSKLSTISTAGKVELGALEIDGASDVGEDLVDADLIIVDNGANGTEVKSTLTRVKKYIYSAMSGDATASDSGALTIANTSVETAMIAADAVTGDKIADDAINSEHYTDGSIDTAHIADAQVTLAKIADQAANTVLVRDANSAGVVSAKAVTDTQILIGDGTGFTAAALSGDVTMTNAGAVTIANGAVENAMLADDAVGADELAANAVVNASIASGAAIEFSKMENLTASRALVSDTNGDVSVSAVTSTEIGYLDGVTSAVQTQIDAKAGKGFAVAMAIAL